MWHYLFKHRVINGLTIVALSLSSSSQIIADVVLMHLFQGVIEFDFNRFIFWLLILLGVWFFIFAFRYAEVFAESYAIRIMNNDVRRDIALTLTEKEHHEFYEKLPVNIFLNLQTTLIN